MNYSEISYTHIRTKEVGFGKLLTIRAAGSHRACMMVVLALFMTNMITPTGEKTFVYR